MTWRTRLARSGLLTIAVGCLALGPASLRAATITVFAASSLSDCLRPIARTYETNSGDKIVFNFAASGTLARQIAAGARADILFSADTTSVDTLASQGLIVPQTRVDRLSNTLVVIVPVDGAVPLEDIRALDTPAVRRLAIGDPRYVPAGAYAKAVLEEHKVWAGLAGKIVPCDNVRAVLAAVQSGNVEAGVVYRTDVAAGSKIKVAFELPASERRRIVYPMVLLKDSPEPAASQGFLRWLNSDAAGAAFAAAGFKVLPAAKER